MATAEVKPPSKKGDWKEKAWLGSLPEDFLRVAKSTSQLQEDEDAETARQLQAKYAQQFHASNAMSRLAISIVQARLVKNYGMTRMDPYVRLRVGHTVYETPTCLNGAKTPSWNKVIRCYISPGVTRFSLEVFDERSLTVDELIAWTEITIPETVLNKGETHDEWYKLSGKQGEEQEGTIQVVMSLEKVAATPAPPPVMLLPGVPGQVYVTQPAYYQKPPTAPAQPPLLTTELLEELQDMFPSVEESVIRSVFEANLGNKEATVNSLLQLSS